MSRRARSLALWGVAIALASAACAGPDGPVSEVDPTSEAGADHSSHHPTSGSADGDADAMPGTEAMTPHADSDGSGTTEATLAAIRAMEPDRLASLHDHGTGHGSGHGGAQAAPRHPRGVDPERIVIPDIDVDAKVVDLGLQDDGSMEVPADFAEAGWFAAGPRPGRVGPAVLAGHVDSRNGPAVFYRLSELEVGEEIQVHGDDGQVVIFSVTSREQHPKDDFPTDRVYSGTPGAELRLITCGGEFDPARRSYRDNVIVYAERSDL